MRNVSNQSTSGVPGNPSALGAVSLLGGGAVLIYALGNTWANLTSDRVSLKLSSSDFDAITTTQWAPGGHIIAPYVISVPATSVPEAARWMLQIGHSLLPLLWAGVMVALGLVLMRVGQSQSAFESPVRRAVNALLGLLAAVALVPTGLVLFGTNFALDHLGWGARTYSALGDTWIPLVVFYLAMGFRATLIHGAKLADELEQVI